MHQTSLLVIGYCICMRNPVISVNSSMSSTSSIQWPCFSGLLRCLQGSFRVWGASAAGHSVLLHLYGFQAHFWLAAPRRQVQQRGMLPASQTSDSWRRLVGLLCSTRGRPVAGATVQLPLYY